MSKLLQDAVAEVSKIPGHGRRTAVGLGIHPIGCNNLSDTDVCPICSNPERYRGTVCVVEQVGDLMSV